MSEKNRSRLARMRAGLSTGQAAKLLDIDRDDLVRIECALSLADDESFMPRMVEAYAVRVEWLTGQVPRYDYAAMKDVEGWDKVSQHDRDMIAEFAASMPRYKAKTLDEIRAGKKELRTLDEVKSSLEEASRAKPWITGAKKKL